ncbi:MAG: hypothetical protein KAW41_03480 [Candidatus Diapherotrites archaeon]|nr:hypothetical protein [Candidatus Diapherotrites archaeon]
MVDTGLAPLAVAQIVVQLGAAFLAWKITRYTDGIRAWGFIIIALLLMTLRRVTALLLMFGLMPEIEAISIVDKLALPLIISVLMLLGMWDLLGMFTKKYGGK